MLRYMGFSLQFDTVSVNFGAGYYIIINIIYVVFVSRNVHGIFEIQPVVKYKPLLLLYSFYKARG